MGGLEGMQGAWGYVQGGMGALSDAIANSATAHGASIFTEKVTGPSIPSSGDWLESFQNLRFRSSLILSMDKAGLGVEGLRYVAC